MIAFDIETGPLPADQLQAVAAPFEAPPQPGEFDESTVKYGNLKDEAKRQAKLESAKKAHADAIRDHEKKVSEAKEQWWAEIVSKAALSPLTGRVLAIGYRSTDSDKSIIDIDDEPKLLCNFWTQFERCRNVGRVMAGHNIAGFDVPFIVRRSWVHGVDVPDGVFDRGRYLNSKVFVDTMQLWQCGGRDYAKLDTLAKAFGMEGKLEGVDGSMFADLLESDRETAIAYLTQDITVTANVAERMGVL